MPDANRSARTVGVNGVAFLVVRRGVGSSDNRPRGTSGFAGACKGAAPGDLVPVQIDDGIGFFTVAVGNVVELLFGIFGKVARLVNADTSNAQVLGVAESLIQGVRNDAVRLEIQWHGSDRGNGIVLCRVGPVLAETFHGSAFVGCCGVPYHRPDGANQIVGCRLLLFDRKKGSGKKQDVRKNRHFGSFF